MIRLLQANGELEKAIAEYEALIRASPQNPEFVFEHTGQQVGGVAPVGHPRPVRTVVDPDLAQFGVLWAGGGDKYTMFATNFEELVAMTAGTVIPVA